MSMAFNKYFTIKGPDLSNNIPKCKDYNEKIHETPMLNSVVLDDVSGNEIVNLSKSKTYGIIANSQSYCQTDCT